MKHYVLLLLLLLPAFGACSDDPPVQAEEGITVTGSDLPPTGSDFHYKLWLGHPVPGSVDKNPDIDHGSGHYVAVGTFKVDDAGTMSGLGGGPATFTLPTGYTPALVTDALLSIELNAFEDVAPGPVVLAGDFFGTASLGIDTLTLFDGYAFGDTIRQILEPVTPHRYILNTPTTADPGDYASGIWFVTSENGSFLPSLRLPAQPINRANTSWRYEAWLVDNRVVTGGANRYVSLGRFRSAVAKDLNGAGSGAGPDSTLAHDAPGEDFVTAPGRMLTSGEYGLVVSLQPIGPVINYPFIVLMKRETIPTGLGPLQSDALSTAVARPTLVIRLVR